MTDQICVAYIEKLEKSLKEVEEEYARWLKKDKGPVRCQETWWWNDMVDNAIK